MSASTNPPGVQTSPSRISKSNFSILRYSPFLYFGKLCLQVAQKDLESRRAKNRSFDSAQDRLGGGVLRQYVVARRLSATKDMSLFYSLLENRYLIGSYRCQLCLTQQVKSENIFSAYV